MVSLLPLAQAKCSPVGDQRIHLHVLLVSGTKDLTGSLSGGPGAERKAVRTAGGEYWDSWCLGRHDG
ncbi:unnamed protein product, partial [Nesidiocoris tenuis]